MDIGSDDEEDLEFIMLYVESDGEFDGIFDKIKEGVVKKVRMIVVSDSRYEKFGGVKCKFYLGVVIKDMERLKRKRWVKIVVSFKIGNYGLVLLKFFVGLWFGICNIYYSDGRILMIFNIFYYFYVYVLLFYVLFVILCVWGSDGCYCFFKDVLLLLVVCYNCL